MIYYNLLVLGYVRYQIRNILFLIGCLFNRSNAWRDMTEQGLRRTTQWLRHVVEFHVLLVNFPWGQNLIFCWFFFLTVMDNYGKKPKIEFELKTTTVETYSWLFWGVLQIIFVYLFIAGCGAKSGVCQVGQQTYNAGISNMRLHFDDGILYLNLSGGDPCHHVKKNRETIIQFVCSPSHGSQDLGKPVFVSENDCTYFVVWHTSLVCERQVSTIDLDLL